MFRYVAFVTVVVVMAAYFFTGMELDMLGILLCCQFGIVGGIAGWCSFGDEINNLTVFEAWVLGVCLTCCTFGGLYYLI